MISSVDEWIRAFKIRRTSVLDERPAERPRLDHTESKTLSMFTENKFHSVRTLAQELGVSLSTAYDRLVNVLGFSSWRPRLVPHLLARQLKAERITTSIEMLRILQTRHPMNFAGVVTGDESWFFSRVVPKSCLEIGGRKCFRKGLMKDRH
jgi:hypothetical protein